MAATSKYPSLYLVFLFFFIILPITYSKPLPDNSDRPMNFIVHMAESQKPYLFTSHHHWYNSIINSLSPSNHPSELLYTYEKVVNGFSARITPSQAAKLKDIPGVLSVRPEQIHKIQTTHTPEFLGLSENWGVWPYSNYGEDIIIGVLDTGIWPEHQSFSDAGLSPKPSTWKGYCENWPNFPASSCNQKLIAARSFLNGVQIYSAVDTRSPRDTAGHGTHVASTIAGAAVTNAGYGEYAKGTAIGIAPKARIAVYKVCLNSTYCGQASILAGMDKAVSDGVHIISMSISGGTWDYDLDDSSIASFGAMESGVLVSVSAGNSGPNASTVNHLPPWVLTVGASSINRELQADVILGSSRTFSGATLYTGAPLSSNSYPLVYAGDFQNPYCEYGAFSTPSQLAGKIVVCEDHVNVSIIDKEFEVKAAKGVGIININSKETWEELQAQPLSNPWVRVSYSDGNQIKQYIRSSRNPTATILFRGTIFGTVAPKVATFSSRGPNLLTPQILKPDVIAPGLNIIAAWTGAVGPWGVDFKFDQRRVEFNIISGTSMACPHVSGIAALLKKAYPNWSPAATKSAIMTTTYNVDNSGQSIKDLSTGKESTPFVHGAGHVDPNKALDPGLVYNLSVTDYIGFLCSIGYDYQRIRLVSRDPIGPNICYQTYAALGGQVTPGDLNLPSFSVFFNSKQQTLKYRRTVTNVGSNVNADYTAYWYAPPGTTINVVPNRLVFSSGKPKLTYEVTFSSTGSAYSAPRFGWIEWNDGNHRVRSPIAFRW